MRRGPSAGSGSGRGHCSAARTDRLRAEMYGGNVPRYPAVRLLASLALGAASQGSRRGCCNYRLLSPPRPPHRRHPHSMFSLSVCPFILLVITSPELHRFTERLMLLLWPAGLWSGRRRGVFFFGVGKKGSNSLCVTLVGS